MSKSSFDVAIHNEKVIVFGVTSIMPNLNGVLLQTEDRYGYQIDSHAMKNGATLSIEYYNPDFMEIPEDYVVKDHRA